MSRTNQILIAVVAAVGAVCAFYFLALAPKREQAAQLETDIAAKQVEVEAARATLATYEAARETYKANYATLARLGKAVPPDDDVNSLLIQLEDAADSTGVDFQKIELGAGGSATTTTGTPGATGDGTLAAAPGTVEVAGGALSAMPFSFAFTGGFFDLSTFLARVERFVSVKNQDIDVTGRLLRLESVEITPSPAGFPDMQAQINAATYIVPPTDPVPAAAGAAPAGTQATTTAAVTTGAP